MKNVCWLVCVLVGGMATGVARGEGEGVRPMKDVVTEVKAAMEQQGVATVDATVEAIDETSRILTVRGPKGNAITMKIGPNASNVGRIKVGDTLRVEYREPLILSIKPAVSDQQPGSMKSTLSAPNKPAVTQKEWNTQTVTIESVDTTARTVTFPESGRSTTLKVDGSVTGLDQFRAGELVTIYFEEALVLSIVPSTPAK
jgi:hypothetical protein